MNKKKLVIVATSLSFHLLFMGVLILAGTEVTAGEQPPSQLFDYETSSLVVTKAKGAITCHKPRLTPYEPNFMSIQKAQNDERAIRVHYSFKYSVYPPRDEVPCTEASSITGSGLDHIHDIYLSFTGEFDFYQGTRPSGPVVNRTSNPAIHFRFQKDLIHLPIDWLDIGIEHRSDGQTVEPTEPAEAARAQIAYSNNDHQYFDRLSRGSNYVSFEARKTFTEQALSTYAKLKLYRTQDTQITWGPLAGKNISISDYDRVRIVFLKKIKDGELSIDWTIGDKLFKTDSWNADYLFSKNWPFPIFVRFHYGPMQTLSNYTQEQSVFGVGLKFTP